MLQVDTSKDKVQGQRWDFCWQRNNLQVPEHCVALHCGAVCSLWVCLGRCFSLSHFTAHFLYSLHDAVLSSDCCNVEWKCRTVLVCLRGCFQRHLQYVASTETATQPTQKLVRSAANSYLLVMYFISLSLFRRSAIYLVLRNVLQGNRLLNMI
jgi:hypothetical protein